MLTTASGKEIGRSYVRRNNLINVLSSRCLVQIGSEQADFRSRL
jgi:hypothetical protein